MAEKLGTLIDALDVVVTVDDDRRLLRNHTIGIADGLVAGIWPTDEAGELQASQRISGRGRMAIPGLIDCHLHSSFALSRGLADECGAREFLLERMYRYEASLTADDVALSARLAMSELLLHGVTTFIDPGNTFPEATADAAGQLGIRASIGRSLFDVATSAFGSVPDNLWQETDQALAQAVADVDAYADHERVWPSTSFRGVNNASDQLIKGLHEVARDGGLKLQTHAAFNYSTRDASMSKHGRSEIRRLHDLGVLDETMFLVHAGWLSADDLEILVDSGAAVVISPSSSLHNGYGNLQQGRHLELATRGVKVALGSDHASSGLVDLIREAYLLCGHTKEQNLDAKTFPPETAVEMMTVNAATVAGRPELGRLAVGSPADVVLIDLHRPEMQPAFNPVSALIYSGSGPLVTDVLVDGQHVVADGVLQTIDLAELVADIEAFVRRTTDERGYGELIRNRWG